MSFILHQLCSLHKTLYGVQHSEEKAVQSYNNTLQQQALFGHGFPPALDPQKETEDLEERLRETFGSR